MIHLVWKPRHKKIVLNGSLATRISELLYLCAEANGWKIVGLKIYPNFVHLVVQLVPNVSISKMMQYFKGKSGRIIRQEFPELKEVYGGDGFWKSGYFAATTAGQCDAKTILAYVKNY